MLCISLMPCQLRRHKLSTDMIPPPRLLLTAPCPWQPFEVQTVVVQEYAAATAEAEMAEAKSVRQGEEAEAFRRIADEKRLLAYQLADQWTGGSCPSPSLFCFDTNLTISHGNKGFSSPVYLGPFC